MSTTNKPLVLFDLDGTITDPGVGIRNGYRAAFAAVGLPSPADDVIDSWIGPPLRVAFPQLGIPDVDVEAAVAGYRAVYNDTGWLENRVYDGLPDVFPTLATGGASLAVATSKPQGLAGQILGHFGLDHHFDYIGGATMDASRDSKAKVIEHVLAQFDATRAVMVGDRSADVIGATEHGLATIGVTWGYGSAEELLDAGAVAVAKTPTHLIEHLSEILS
ncbi:MAG: phosphoglycolate phosphatase [Candidatus Poriferisodalaceae bacterium]